MMNVHNHELGTPAYAYLGEHVTQANGRLSAFMASEIVIVMERNLQILMCLCFALTYALDQITATHTSCSIRN